MPAALAIALLLVLVAIVVLARRAAQPDAPAEPGAFATPAGQQTAAWNVEGVDGTTLIVSGGPAGTSRLVVPPSTPVEVLEMIATAEITSGAWLTVVGVPNEVKNFAIRLIVVIPSPAAPGDAGTMRSAAGFFGHEAERDQKEAPLLGGFVDSVDASRVTIRAAAGLVDVSLAQDAPLRRLRSAADSNGIRSGDRVAVHLNGDGSPNVAGGILVLAGGAR